MARERQQLERPEENTTPNSMQSDSTKCILQYHIYPEDDSTTTVASELCLVTSALEVCHVDEPPIQDQWTNPIAKVCTTHLPFQLPPMLKFVCVHVAMVAGGAGRGCDSARCGDIHGNPDGTAGRQRHGPAAVSSDRATLGPRHSLHPLPPGLEGGVSPHCGRKLNPVLPDRGCLGVHR